MMMIMGSGVLIGSLSSFPLTGWLCKCGFAGGWPSVFYVSGMQLLQSNSLKDNTSEMQPSQDTTALPHLKPLAHIDMVYIQSNLFTTTPLVPLKCAVINKLLL